MSACSCEPDNNVVGPCHGERDHLVCYHCSEPLDGAMCIEAMIGPTVSLFCSTFCAFMVIRFEHGDACDVCDPPADIVAPTLTPQEEDEYDRLDRERAEARQKRSDDRDAAADAENDRRKDDRT